MAVSFTLPPERSRDLVGFAWSPLFESVLSIKAALHPKKSPMFLPWARRCRELPEDLRAEMALLIGHFDKFVPGVFEVGVGGASPDFGDELAAFDQLDDEVVAYELSLALGGLGCSIDRDGPALVDDPAYRDVVLAASAGDDERLALAKATLDDPADVRQRYSAMLRRYWDSAFEAEWARILPRIEAEVTHGAHALVTGGVSSLTAELLPEAHWDPGRSAIVVERDWDGDCDVAERGGLLIVPTVYGWPCVLIELATPWPAAIFFPLRDLRQPAVPQASDAEVVEGFRALGDETRLQIARLVAENARSTTELAELLSLSHSAISRNLKILESAGLVTSRRDGYFVLYELVPGRVDVLGRAVRNTLGLLQSSSGDVPALPVSMPRVPTAGAAR